MKIKKIKQNKGVATLELLIAFTILVLNITAVALIINGGQSISVDSETNEEAIAKAESYLEDTRKMAKNDFSSVVSETTTEMSGSLEYTKILTILDLAQCKKQATSEVSWMLSSLRPQRIELTTLVTDIAGVLALGGDCDIEPLGEWDNPITAVSVSIGGGGATDIDARNNIVYLTSDPSAGPKEDFFIYQFDSDALVLTELSKIHVSGGLNNVDAIEDYAFTTNSETSNHLMIFNTAVPASPTLVSSSSLPNMTVGVARSIFYYDDFVYIGTQYLACPACLPAQNNEFHIYDVSNPGALVWRGSYKVNHNINDIVVRGDYAYLATSDNNGEVYIYDVSSPASITFEGLFNASGNEDGEALYLLGDKLYVGRDRTPVGRQDFYILDISNPSSPSELGSKNLGLNSGAVVKGVVVKGKLAFLGLDNPTSGIQILNISNPASITNHPACTTLNFSENSSAIDMDGDFIFTANISNDEIRVIRDQVTTCP